MDAALRPAHPRPMRRRGRDATDRASVPRRAKWPFPNRADAAEIGVDAAEIGADVAQIGPTRSVSACIGRNGLVRPKFKKKKKGANAPFYLVISQHSCSGISKEKLNFIP